MPKTHHILGKITAKNIVSDSVSSKTDIVGESQLKLPNLSEKSTSNILYFDHSTGDVSYGSQSVGGQNLHSVALTGNVTSQTLELTNASVALEATGNIVGHSHLLLDGLSEKSTSNILYFDHSTGDVSYGPQVQNFQTITNLGSVTSQTLELTNSSVGIKATGNVEAAYFVGDGSLLTNLPNSGGIGDGIEENTLTNSTDIAFLENDTYTLPDLISSDKGRKKTVVYDSFNSNRDIGYTTYSSDDFNNVVKKVIKYGNYYYISGIFGVKRQSVSSGTVEDVPNLSITNTVQNIIIHNGKLYVCGVFDNVNGDDDYKHFVIYDIINGIISKPSINLSNPVTDMHLLGSKIYLIGSFTNGDYPYLAAYDIDSNNFENPLGDNKLSVNPGFTSITSDGNNDIFLAGINNGTFGGFLNKVDTSTGVFTDLLSSVTVDPSIRALAYGDGFLYIGSSSEISSSRFNRMNLNDNTLENLGFSSSDVTVVWKILVQDDAIYVGGSKNPNSSGLAVKYLFSDQTWSDILDDDISFNVNSNDNTIVYEIYISDGNEIFIGGQISLIGGRPTNRLVKLSGILSIKGSFYSGSPQTISTVKGNRTFIWDGTHWLTMA